VSGSLILLLLEKAGLIMTLTGSKNQSILLRIAPTTSHRHYFYMVKIRAGREKLDMALSDKAALK
jgi:hypothetical protein